MERSAHAQKNVAEMNFSAFCTNFNTEAQGERQGRNKHLCHIFCACQGERVAELSVSVTDTNAHAQQGQKRGRIVCAELQTGRKMSLLYHFCTTSDSG